MPESTRERSDMTVILAGHFGTRPSPAVAGPVRRCSEVSGHLQLRLQRPPALRSVRCHRASVAPTNWPDPDRAEGITMRSLFARSKFAKTLIAAATIVFTATAGIFVGIGIANAATGDI